MRVVLTFDHHLSGSHIGIDNAPVEQPGERGIGVGNVNPLPAIVDFALLHRVDQVGVEDELEDPDHQPVKGAGMSMAWWDLAQPGSHLTGKQHLIDLIISQVAVADRNEITLAALVLGQDFGVVPSKLIEKFLTEWVLLLEALLS